MPPEDDPRDEQPAYPCGITNCQGSVRLVTIPPGHGHSGDRWECDACGYICRDSGIDE